MDFLTQESLVNLLGAAMASQVTQFGVAFSIAAFIHAGRMKKEISSQMGNVVDALNNLATALRQDMAEQSKRIDKVEFEVSVLKKTKGAK